MNAQCNISRTFPAWIPAPCKSTKLAIKPKLASCKLKVGPEQAEFSEGEMFSSHSACFYKALYYESLDAIDNLKNRLQFKEEEIICLNADIENAQIDAEKLNDRVNILKDLYEQSEALRKILEDQRKGTCLNTKSTSNMKSLNELPGLNEKISKISIKSVQADCKNLKTSKSKLSNRSMGRRSFCLNKSVSVKRFPKVEFSSKAHDPTTEDLIEKIQRLNDENQSLKASIREITKSYADIFSEN